MIDLWALSGYDPDEPIVAVVDELRRQNFEVIAGAKVGLPGGTMVVLDLTQGDAQVMVVHESAYRQRPQQVAQLLLFHAMARRAMS